MPSSSFCETEKHSNEEVRNFLDSKPNLEAETIGNRARSRIKNPGNFCLFLRCFPGPDPLSPILHFLKGRTGSFSNPSYKRLK